MTHQIVNVVTAFVMGAILMALGFVLLTRTGGCEGSSPPAATMPVVGTATGNTTPWSAQEVERIARQAVRSESAAQKRRERDVLCDDPLVPFHQRRILGCAGADRDPMCSDPSTTYEQRQILACDGDR